MNRLSACERADEAGADALVLGTVNAPFRRQIEEEALAACLRTGDFGSWLVHVATFLSDVSPELIVGFSSRHGVGVARLAHVYDAIESLTGIRNGALEAILSNDRDRTEFVASDPADGEDAEPPESATGHRTGPA
jgi:hypothetical protein